MKVYVILSQMRYDYEFECSIEGVFKTKKEAIKEFKKISKKIKKDYKNVFDIETLVEEETTFFIENYNGGWDKLTIEESEMKE